MTTNVRRVLLLGSSDEGVAPPSTLSETSGFEVETARTHAEAYDHLSRNHIDCVLASVDGARTRTMDAVVDHPAVSVCILVETNPEVSVVEVDSVRSGGQLANGGQSTKMPGKRTVLSHQIETALRK